MKKFFKQWYSRIFSDMHHKYRLVIMNEAFEEKISFRLSRQNVFVYIGMTAIILVVGTLALIAFTSLREFIPGYTKDEIVEMAYHNQSKIDSLENFINAQEKLMYAMNLAISGEMPVEKVEDMQDSTIRNYDTIVYERSEEDEQLREQIEQGERFNLAQERPVAKPEQSELTESTEESSRTQTIFSTQSLSNTLFYIPLEGSILADFDAFNKHFGIDITGKKNDVIKAIQNGTVISAEWTTDGGYVIAIQHENNMVSVYKHNSAVLKRVGDYVKAGEPIAFIGTSGEGYKGPILHFALWYNGSPVNPRDYVAF
jgi:murein DD-endopeptidase MepM/ murein hydrolase activator NlpD